MSEQDHNDSDLYDTVVKVSGIILALLLWYISMRFSVDGFRIATEEDAWIGWVLGGLVTYLQVLFNRGNKNETMYWAGIVAYVYGLATNLMGILAVRGQQLSMATFSENFIGGVLQLVVVLAIAAAVEILPEHLFINALRPDGGDGDFIASLRRGLDGIRGSGRKPSSNKGNRNPKGSNNQQNHNHGGNQQQSRKPRPGDNQRPPMDTRGGRPSNVTIVDMDD